MKNTKQKSPARKYQNNSQSQNPNQIWLCGKHSVFSALEKKRRKIFEIIATKNTISDLEKFLQKQNLLEFKSLIKIVDNNKIDSVVGANQIHQGIAMLCSKLPVKTQNDLLTELYLKVEQGEKLPTLLMLDQLSDPHNIGAIIRSASAFGVKKIIFLEHNAPKENATIVKSSAGTIELIELITVVNFSNLIEKLKKINYWCIGLAGEGKSLISDIKGYDNIALIIGSEGDGIRSLIKKNCDILAKIKIGNEVESLNASVATSIALYELFGKKNEI